jgi:anaerobic dimethyl sulfoxide reductase subunit B (iron-sulfur subunit)
MPKQYGFFIDSAKCTGCKTCQLACKDYKDLHTVNFRRVYEYTGGSWQGQSGNTWTSSVFSYYISISCNHCTEPACVRVCPSGAVYKQVGDGLVVVNEDVCIGCKLCDTACPYGAPQFDSRTRPMTKCNGCYERVVVGLKPVCVEACPLRALDFDVIEVLQAKHGKLASVAPLPEGRVTKPNIVLNPNVHSRPTGDKSVFLGNPLEV